MESRKSYQEFKKKYEEVRLDVYKEVPYAINMPLVKLTPINNLALAKYREWSVGTTTRKPPNGGWDWATWSAVYREKYPKRIEIAIWYGGTLCGLALGKMSEKNVHVRLEVLEGSTSPIHPLKGRVAYIALTAVEMFGYALGAEESRVIDPVDGAIRSYGKLGYRLFPAAKKQPRYMSKVL
ncbi:hypothetical protein [Marinobacter xestospongiae]|uniref:N-acetyltransferase domain-containing protein n=1 Tax=Marinobacter xestospongiae TaxID=994319 RepID=A0ABU3W3X6_9GAMM|nr:hypothetical protein [Marinobacter xestospongiae]MDV2081238.1 hypothetical protein [Marinobacter xestospongiae]